MPGPHSLHGRRVELRPAFGTPRLLLQKREGIGGRRQTRRAADITLVGDNLNRLADLFTLSRRTACVIRQNLFWACLYNAVCIPLAVLGLVNPLVAAAAILVSSMSVVFNTKRLRRQLARA